MHTSTAAELPHTARQEGEPALAVARCRLDGQAIPALVLNGRVYDEGAMERAGMRLGELGWPKGGIPALLEDWERGVHCLRAVATRAAELSASGKLTPLADAARHLVAPFVPERIYCAASNYIEHANEMGTVLAEKAKSRPYMFLKLRNAVIGPHEAIRKPAETAQLDWEIELAAVIGKRGRRVSVDGALQHVAGYAIVNDISARDLNVRGDYPFKFDWFQGKCHDTFAPFGPWMVPAWAIPDPQSVRLRLKVNGEVMQDDSTRHMIWTLREQIAYLSTIVTLEPGDVIATGTPTGVGMGRGVFLQPGDVVSAWIEGIGTLTNPVLTEAH